MSGENVTSFRIGEIIKAIIDINEDLGKLET